MRAKGAEMGLSLQPDEQRVSVVASQMPFDPPDLAEAAEIVFSGIAGISADELLDEAVGALQSAPFHYEERRSRTEWGASGPEIQEIIINFAANVGSGVTVAAILASLKALRDRREKDGRAQGRYEVKSMRAADNADLAWQYFSEHLKRAYKVSRPRAVEVRQIDDGWWLLAQADSYTYEGTVDLEGRVIFSRRVEGKANVGP
jgi:hypothetical protein